MLLFFSKQSHRECGDKYKERPIGHVEEGFQTCLARVKNVRAQNPGKETAESKEQDEHDVGN